MVVNGVEVESSRVGVAVLAHIDAISEPVPESELPACSDMYAEVTGKRGGESVTIRMDALSHEGLPRMDAATGLSAAVGILMMGRGQIAEKGVHAPEGCVDTALFLEQLDELGVYIKETEVSLS